MSEETTGAAKPKSKRLWLYIGLFALAAVLTVVVVGLLANIQKNKKGGN